MSEVRMMNDEVKCRTPVSLCLLPSTLAGFLDDRDEDSGQFVALGTKRLQTQCGNDFSIGE